MSSYGMTIYGLRQSAKEMIKHAADMARTAQILERIPTPPGAHVVEIAGMLAGHGLCVIEREALRAAHNCMLVDVDADGFGAHEFAQAQSAVLAAIELPPLSCTQDPIEAEDECRDLDDAAIDKIAGEMPGGVDGFLKTWGWRQFARSVIEADRKRWTIDTE